MFYDTVSKKKKYTNRYLYIFINTSLPMLMKTQNNNYNIVKIIVNY